MENTTLGEFYEAYVKGHLEFAKKEAEALQTFKEIRYSWEIFWIYHQSKPAYNIITSLAYSLNLIYFGLESKLLL